VQHAEVDPFCFPWVEDRLHQIAVMEQEHRVQEAASLVGKAFGKRCLVRKGEVHLEEGSILEGYDHDREEAQVD